MLKVIVVGSGFAGIKLIRELAGKKNIQITLITDSLTFRYCPALYRTATGKRKRESIIPVNELLSGIPNVKLSVGKVTHIDREKRIITRGDGTKYHYDVAVIAIGVVTSYFGIPGLEDYAYGIKSASAIDKLKKHLHKQLMDEGLPDKNYVVVGGGPTGVELSAALSSYLRKIARKHKTRRTKINLEVIEAAPRLLPSMSPRASKKVAKRLRKLKVRVMTNKKVESSSSDSLIVNDRIIPSKTVIWTAGVTNNPFFVRNKDQFALNDRGKVIVNDHLQVDNHTFVIGDNAATPYSGLALTAVHNAKYVAKDIIAISKNKESRAYKPLSPISIVPAGPRWAVLQWKKITITGWFAAMLRSLADLVGYMDVMGIKSALKVWFFSHQLEEICKVCKTKPTTSNYSKD
jgi:NADH:ubiquinone reductase (H+-translocating)